MIYIASLLSSTRLDKNTTCQGRGLGIRKINKEYNDANTIIKQKPSNSTEREFQWILKLPTFNFPYILYPSTREKKAKDCFNIIQRITWTVTYFNALRHQIISILLFKQWTHTRPSILKAAIANIKPSISKEGADICLHILAICQGGLDLLVWAILMSKEASNRILTQDV